MRSVKLALIILGWILVTGHVVAAKTLAVIVGVQLKNNPLNFTIDDAQLMRQILPPGDDDVILLCSDATRSDRLPTRANIIRTVTQVAARCQPADVFLFYFSGHGSEVANSSMLVPHDTDYYPESFIAVSDLRKILEDKKTCQAKAKLIILDACHSGATKAIRPMPWENLIGSAQGVMTFAACKVEEKSSENSQLRHGVFTYFLAYALSGKANPTGNAVTLRQLKDYVENGVPQYLNRMHSLDPQHPQFIGLPPDIENATIAPLNTRLRDLLPDPAQATVPEGISPVAPRPPLKPGLIVLMSGTEAAGVAANELRQHFIEQRFPVLAAEKAQGLLAALQNPDAPAAALAVERLTSRFLVRGTVTSTVRRLGADLGGAISVQVTINAQLIDAEGNVLGEVTSDSATGRPITAAGATEQSAGHAAIRQAAQRVFENLLPRVEAVLARDHTATGPA